MPLALLPPWFVFSARLCEYFLLPAPLLSRVSCLRSRLRNIPQSVHSNLHFFIAFLLFHALLYHSAPVAYISDRDKQTFDTTFLSLSRFSFSSRLPFTTFRPPYSYLYHSLFRPAVSSRRATRTITLAAGAPTHFCSTCTVGNMNSPL